VLPARPYKPRDKAIVESAVQVAQRWILASLRHRKFFSLAEANQSIGELLYRINHRPFRKRDGSRASVFEALDKPALQPLPQERFEISEWEKARVNIDYHVAFDGNFYSVPCRRRRLRNQLRRRGTTTSVERSTSSNQPSVALPTLETGSAHRRFEESSPIGRIGESAATSRRGNETSGETMGLLTGKEQASEIKVCEFLCFAISSRCASRAWAV
jgi:hypothetical protein